METAPFTGCSLHQRNRRSSRGKCSHRHRHIRIRRLPPLISADIGTLRRREITYEPRRCCDGLPVAMPRFDLSQAHAPLSAAAFVESSLGMLRQQDWDGLPLSLWPSPLGTIAPWNCFRLNKSVSSGAFTLRRDASLEERGIARSRARNVGTRCAAASAIEAALAGTRDGFTLGRRVI